MQYVTQVGNRFATAELLMKFAAEAVLSHQSNSHRPANHLRHPLNQMNNAEFMILSVFKLIKIPLILASTIIFIYIIIQLASISSLWSAKQ